MSRWRPWPRPGRRARSSSPCGGIHRGPRSAGVRSGEQLVALCSGHVQLALCRRDGVLVRRSGGSGRVERGAGVGDVQLRGSEHPLLRREIALRAASPGRIGAGLRLLQDGHRRVDRCLPLLLRAARCVEPGLGLLDRGLIGRVGVIRALASAAPAVSTAFCAASFSDRFSPRDACSSASTADSSCACAAVRVARAWVSAAAASAPAKGAGYPSAAYSFATAAATSASYRPSTGPV